MATAQIILFVAFAFQEDSPAILNVTNNTSEALELAVRASDRHREWTVVRLLPTEKRSVRLVSADPFDIEVRRGHWFVRQYRRA
jgi:hypothetical protein